MPPEVKTAGAEAQKSAPKTPEQKQANTPKNTEAQTGSAGAVAENVQKGGKVTDAFKNFARGGLQKAREYFSKPVTETGGMAGQISPNQEGQNAQADKFNQKVTGPDSSSNYQYAESQKIQDVLGGENGLLAELKKQNATPATEKKVPSAVEGNLQVPNLPVTTEGQDKTIASEHVFQKMAEFNAQQPQTTMVAEVVSNRSAADVDVRAKIDALKQQNEQSARATPLGEPQSSHTSTSTPDTMLSSIADTDRILQQPVPGETQAAPKPTEVVAAVAAENPVQAPSSIVETPQTQAAVNPESDPKTNLDASLTSTSSAEAIQTTLPDKHVVTPDASAAVKPTEASDVKGEATTTPEDKNLSPEQRTEQEQKQSRVDMGKIGAELGKHNLPDAKVDAIMDKLAQLSPSEIADLAKNLRGGNEGLKTMAENAQKLDTELNGANDQDKQSDKDGGSGGSGSGSEGEITKEEEETKKKNLLLEALKLLLGALATLALQALESGASPEDLQNFVKGLATPA